MRYTRFITVVQGIIFLCLWAGCVGAEDEPFRCEDGDAQACYCLGGVTGFQSCRDDLAGWGPCECEGVPGVCRDSTDQAVSASP